MDYPLPFWYYADAERNRARLRRRKLYIWGARILALVFGLVLFVGVYTLIPVDML